jgi:hypothetical protein
MAVPFGNWAPDRDGATKTIEGAVPQSASTGIGYGPFPQLVAAAAAVALPGDPRGIISLQKADGSWAVFAGTATTIEMLASNYSWTEIENTRTVPTGDDVSFARFGKYLISTDTSDGMKAYDIDAGGANTAISGAPSARFVFQCNNVLFGLGTASSPRRLQNSDIGNYAKWSGGAADGKTMEDGGNMVGGADLKNGVAVIFQEFAMRGIQFGSGASTYSIVKIADGRGCVGARTIAAFDGRVFWWDTDGPWMMTPGTAPVPIGAEKINRWAEDSIGRQNYATLQASIDPVRNLVIWRIDASRLLAFNWLIGEFSILPVSTVALARLATPAVSIDGLSGTIDGLAGTIDGLGGGSAPQLGALNSSRKFALFSGQNMAATLETGRLINPVTGLMNWATPMDDCATGTLQVGVAGSASETLSWKTGASKVRAGRVPLRARGMNVAFRRNIPAGADWTYANGVDNIAVATGGPK